MLHTCPTAQAVSRAGRPKAATPPSTSTSAKLLCGECQQTLDEASSLPVEERQPCPNYDSLIRTHKITFYVTLMVHEFVRIRSKCSGKDGWIQSLRIGDNYSRYLKG